MGKKSSASLPTHDKSTVKAGLQFPVDRIGCYLKKGRYTQRIDAGAPVYLTAEVLELSGNAVKDNKKNCIFPRHLLLVIRNDDELRRVLSDITIPYGCVVPNINLLLPPKGTAEKASTGGSKNTANKSPKKTVESPDEA